VKDPDETPVLQYFIESVIVIIILALSNCAVPNKMSPAASPLTATSLPVTPPDTACPISEPTWAKPPDDTAVLSTPAFGYYTPTRINRSGRQPGGGKMKLSLATSSEGLKVGWFRPAGETLEITGRRLDGHPTS
jgi:hypothetical protein